MISRSLRHQTTSGLKQLKGVALFSRSCACRFPREPASIALSAFTVASFGRVVAALGPNDAPHFCRQNHGSRRGAGRGQCVESLSRDGGPPEAQQRCQTMADSGPSCTEGRQVFLQNRRRKSTCKVARRHVRSASFSRSSGSNLRPIPHDIASKRAQKVPGRGFLGDAARSRVIDPRIRL